MQYSPYLNPFTPLHAFSRETSVYHWQLGQNRAQPAGVSAVFTNTIGTLVTAQELTGSYRGKFNHWKSRVDMMPNLSSLLARQIVVTTICCANSDDKYDILMTLGFQCCWYRFSLLLYISQSMSFDPINFVVLISADLLNRCDISTYKLRGCFTCTWEIL